MYHPKGRPAQRASRRTQLRFSRYRRILIPIVVVSLVAAGIPQSLFPAAIAQEIVQPAATSATLIIVDTSEDLDPGSITKTCGYTSGIYVAQPDCTLRRAILEASARPAGDRPIAIIFKLPNGDIDTNVNAWVISIDGALPPLKTPTIVDKNGRVGIDGNANQALGRTDGPKIIIDTNGHSLEVESENNIIRNLAFKGGGAIFLKEEGNTVENIWMGLSDDGQSIEFRNPGNPLQMAGGGIKILSDSNTVSNTVISGTFARAIDIDGGDNNVIQNNLIGTRSDGTVPAVPAQAECNRSLSLDPQNWYGGWGILLSGSNNHILNNRIAGLHIVQSENDTPPLAIEIFGADHEVKGNIIGVDSGGAKVGVCGQGIKVSGSGTDIMDNTIVRSRTGSENGEETAILASDSSPSFGAITVQGNLVEEGPGKIYEFGAGIDQVLRTFKPAKITGINGTTVTGGNGDGSPCPDCRIDFYRDNDDAIAEALEHLGNTTADSNGDFTFNMGSALPNGSGIRTMSTAQSAGVIGSFLGGTTTSESVLYLPMSDLDISGPTTGKTGETHTFNITITPSSATAPFDYTVNATDAAQQTENTNSTTIAVNYSWSTPGTKTLNVTVENALGTLQGSHQITIEEDESTQQVALSGLTIAGPTTGKPGQKYTFNITVTPSTATPPFDYTVDATDATQQTLNTNSTAIVANYTWPSAGVKTLNVTVENALGTLQGSHQITIEADDVADPTEDVYLPAIQS